MACGLKASSCHPLMFKSHLYLQTRTPISSIEIKVAHTHVIVWVEVVPFIRVLFLFKGEGIPTWNSMFCMLLSNFFKHLKVKLPRRSKIPFFSSGPSGAWVIDQNNNLHLNRFKQVFSTRWKFTYLEFLTCSTCPHQKKSCDVVRIIDFLMTLMTSVRGVHYIRTVTPKVV